MKKLGLTHWKEFRVMFNYMIRFILPVCITKPSSTQKTLGGSTTLHILGSEIVLLFLHPIISFFFCFFFEWLHPIISCTKRSHMTDKIFRPHDGLIFYEQFHYYKGPSQMEPNDAIQTCKQESTILE